MATIILRPNAAGDETNITEQYPVSDSHYDKVDEVIADEDATFVYESTGDDNYYRDLYNLPICGPVGAIENITVYARCRTYGAGATRVSMKISIQTGGTVYEGAEETLTSSYANYSKTWALNPKTGIAWVESDIDALQIGISLRNAVEPPSALSSLCTQIWVVITYSETPVMITRIAFETDPFADTPIWDDVSDDVISFSFARGRQHELDRFEAGVATLLLKNDNGDYWPLNTVGEYYPNVDIGKKVNIRVRYNEVYDRYTGFIESMTPIWLSDRGGLVPVMQINCADAVTIFSRTRLNTSYGQQLSGARIGAVLNTVGFPSADRQLDDGQFTMIASGTLENVLAQEHIFKVAESELGLFYIAPDGDAVFEDKSHRTVSPHDVSQATFNDSFADIILSLDDTLLFNEIRLTRQGGAEQVATDSTSKEKYGWRSLVRSGLYVISDLITKLCVYYLLARYGSPAMRAESITIEPQSNPNVLFPQVLGFGISTRITVQKAEGSIDADYFIEGIDEDYDLRDGRWTTRWQISDADRYLYEPEAQVETLRPDSIVTKLNMHDQAGGALTYDELADGLDATYGKKETSTSACSVICSLPNIVKGTVEKVTVYWRVSGANGYMSLGVRLNSVNYFAYDTVSLPLGTYSHEYLLNPATGLAWTWEEVDELQLIVIDVSTYDVYIYDVWAIVNFTPSW